MTLTELLVVSATFSVLGLLVWATFAYETQSSRRNTNVNVVQRNLRVWIARMAGEIREAGFNPLETSPNPFVITSRTCTDFEFSYDADSDGALAASGEGFARENRGYRLDTATHTLQQKSGSAWRKVLYGVQALTFTYRRGDATRTVLNSDCGVTPTWPTQDIGEVQVTIVAQAASGTPGMSDVTVAESISAKLRNEVP